MSYVCVFNLLSSRFVVLDDHIVVYSGAGELLGQSSKVGGRPSEWGLQAADFLAGNGFVTRQGLDGSHISAKIGWYNPYTYQVVTGKIGENQTVFSDQRSLECFDEGLVGLLEPTQLVFGARQLPLHVPQRAELAELVANHQQPHAA
ncbi:MAG: hypothetical protein WC184_12695 [Acidimicrobiia bacterium]